MKKRILLSNNIKDIDTKSFDSSNILNRMKPIFSSESQLVEATELYSKMLNDKDCNIILSISDNSCNKGCLKIFANMIELKMVDAIIVNGNNVLYFDFLDALGFNLFKGVGKNTNSKLGEFYIYTSNGTFIDENDLQYIDLTIKEIADQLQARTYSSKEFLYELGRYLQVYSTNKRSILQLAFENQIPIFSPSLACSKLAVGLLDHQSEKPDRYMLIDPILDLNELTALKLKSGNTGLVLLGKDTISDVAFDIVSYTETDSKQTRRHKYAIQIVTSNTEDNLDTKQQLSETILRNTIDRNTIKNVNMEPNLALSLIINHLQHSKQLKERLFHHIN